MLAGFLLMVFLLPQGILFPLVASSGAVGPTVEAPKEAVVQEQRTTVADSKRDERGVLNDQQPEKAAFPVSESDLQVLAQTINGEARGEPYEGKVAVGAVILNRMRDANFPDSIPGVVYQPGAFTAVSDGQINLRVELESFRAAKDALKGWDPTGGAIYYYNPAKTTNKWIWSRQVVLRIGDHLFAY
ncbi:hypothetical protein SY88_01385 [Clostridiales bacterium PH28_bin88]|nr:hypothetical protein SY88_01385 [Clostridiales bacterium PH28_bin88]